MNSKKVIQLLPTTVNSLTRRAITTPVKTHEPSRNDEYQSSTNLPILLNPEMPLFGFNHLFFDRFVQTGPRNIPTDLVAQTGGFGQLQPPSPKTPKDLDKLKNQTAKKFMAAWPLLKRDLDGLKLLATLKWRMRRAFRRNLPLHHYFNYWVDTQPNKLCIHEIETGRSFTYLEINNLANKYVNHFREKGFRRGDVVGLFMENSADFFALWLGLSKIGVITAWINSNLKMEPLAHSINTAHASTVVTTPQLLPTLMATMNAGMLTKETDMLTVGKTEEPDVPNLADLIYDDTEPPITRGLGFESILCYIYTSGTTGNPKAAVIKHFRYHFMSLASGNAFGVKASDRIYITMPMYHSAAGIIGVGQTIIRGSTAIVRRSFSAQEFWKDAVKHDATVSQYIGEICRYLLAQPTSPEEKKHKIRMMYGNGLRPEIWQEFVDRFGVGRIGEFYGSTEGNSNIVNINSHVGSCGFIPTYPGVSKFYPLRLVKVNLETNELCRDENGLCIPCEPGDTGEVIAVIKKDCAQTSFEGYLDQAESEKKVIRNVFAQGDAAFSSGDILLWDTDGYLYFKDRRGDTYRWRGENVSTMEVEGVLQPIMSIEDATVYGVEVQGREGRAGMVGATLAENCKVEDLLTEMAERLSENLPAYAIPLFVRICKQVDRTGTHKIKKSDLQSQGFDPAKCKGDSLYYWNADERQYLLLDSKMYEDIQKGVYKRI